MCKYLVNFLFYLICLNLFYAEPSHLLNQSFETKKAYLFEQLKNQPLKRSPKQPPLKKNGPLYTRNYSWSIINFATKAFHLKERQFYAEANHALIENCEYYINSADARDHRDSFYWSAEELSRLIRFFGSKGSVEPNLVQPETEKVIYELMWLWSFDHSLAEESEVQISQSWKIFGSENHHIQNFSTCWNFADLLKDHPAYKDRKFKDGNTARHHYEQWSLYSRTWIKERAKKGLFVEIACGGYNTQTLKCLLSFYDFGDNRLKQLAGQLLDLYWCSWSQEQIDGVRGGFKTRVYQTRKSRSGYEFITRWAAFYFKGIKPDHYIRQADFTLLTSTYRIPEIVHDIYQNRHQLENYEIIERRQGLVHKGYFSGSAPHIWLKSDNGGILRYSYCTPNYILGSGLFNAHSSENWAKISSQNRWHGLILKGHQDARVYLQCKNTRSPSEEIVTFNQSWMLQKKGCLITQKLPLDDISRSLVKRNQDAEKLCIWWSTAGRKGELYEKQGWVFANYHHTYVAAYSVDSLYTLHHEKGSRSKYASDLGGHWQMLAEEYAPVILEVAYADQYKSFDDFITKCIVQSVDTKDDVLRYKSLNGHDFRFYLDRSQLGSIDGQQISLQPQKVFDSPYIKSDFNSGIITLKSPNYQKTLDFN